MLVWSCRVDAALPCNWDAHHYKHFAFAGMTRAHTKHPNPARYLPGYDADRIRELETGTARQPDVRRERSPSKVEYQRDLREPIGWDLEQDATLSFVECTGGDVSRTLHGRPMHVGNRKALVR